MPSKSTKVKKKKKDIKLMSKYAGDSEELSGEVNIDELTEKEAKDLLNQVLTRGEFAQFRLDLSQYTQGQEIRINSIVADLLTLKSLAVKCGLWTQEDYEKEFNKVADDLHKMQTEAAEEPQQPTEEEKKSN